MATKLQIYVLASMRAAAVVPMEPVEPDWEMCGGLVRETLIIGLFG